MIVGEGGDDAGAQLVRLGVSHFQRRHLLEMVVQEPGVVDQAQQNQRLAAGDRTALAAHDRACRKLWARRLVGPGAELRGAGYPLYPHAPRREAATRRPRAGLKAPEGFAAEPTSAGQATPGLGHEP